METKSVLNGIHSIEELNLNGRNVFLRLDLNLPMKDGVITDDTRLQAALPTIKFVMDRGAKLVIASHLGRPKKVGDMSMEPIAIALSDTIGCETLLVEDPVSEAPKALLKGLRSDQVIVLENLRWSEDETSNGADMSDTIASYTDVYINDAFGACHRAHASISGVPSRVAERAAGLLVQKELKMLEKISVNPEHPFVAILGGSKVSDKIAVIEKLMDTVDTFIIGGAMAYTFLAAKGVNVGKSLVEKDKLNFAKSLLERLEVRGKNMLLPTDHIVSRNFDDGSTKRTTLDESIREEEMGLDIGPKTIELYEKEIASAKLVFWNGPMGVFENSDFAKGTFSVAEALANSEATVVVGGGDSASAAKQSGFAEKMDHISTGGGASLEFLQGDALPGLEALKGAVLTDKGFVE